MKVGLIGCGLVGKQRANVVRQSPTDELVIVADIDESHATSLAAEMGCLAITDWRKVVARDDVEVIVVSTPNKYLMPITVAALENGKHVLVEKPMARNLAEAEEVLRTISRQGDPSTSSGQRKGTGRQGDSLLVSPSPCPPLLGVGFNHRHHPAIWKAHELCAQGAIGPLMFIRAVYGHGGRPGYDKEWRADPDLAGGGELLDQGVHIVDLCRWFLGDFSEVVGFTGTYFWGTDRAGEQGRGGDKETRRQRGKESAPPHPLTSSPPHPCSSAPPLLSTSAQIEDNAFALLRTADGRIAQFHTSWTQWKNCFTFEIFGRNGYVRVDGFGGSYGLERLEVGRRKMEGGPPEVEVLEFPGPDVSWEAEWQEFTSAIRESRQPLANGEDGLQVMRLIAAIYESARMGQVVRL